MLKNLKNIIDAKRTILVVEDNELNREILHSILDEKYNVIEAENGQIGLDLLEQNKSSIACILLDIQMPVLDGYGFLEIANQNEFYKQIPVIVMTSDKNEEEKALTEGASDFVTKPYLPSVIFKRIEALIRLKESVHALVETRLDQLTGLSNRAFFHFVSDNLLKQNLTDKFTYILINIKDFSYINTAYGEKECDDLLKLIGSILKELESRAFAISRYSGDSFAILINSEIDYNTAIAEVGAKIKQLSPIKNVELRFAVYENPEKDLTTHIIMNRLFMTMFSMPTNSEKHTILFNKNIIEKENKLHLITSKAQDSLKNQDFKVYIQPKHNCKTNALEGAEALVRWIHPTFGFISPGDFIPTFEDNGFITKLDIYTFKKTCEFQAKLLKMGLKPVPISINLSRRDLAVFTDMELIESTIAHYGISKDLIHFEITESLCGDAGDVIHKAEIIRNAGFKIEIDDFGSGYSSLGLISTIPMDVLKLDITFARNLDKQINVVKYVIALAHDLGAKTVAEGVETEEQKNIYRDLGCDCIQGYFYSKPLSEDDFIAYMKKQ